MGTPGKSTGTEPSNRMVNMSANPAFTLVLLSLWIVAGPGLHRAAAQTSEPGPTVEAVAAKAIQYLKTTARNPDDGSYSSFAGPAITALVTTGMLRHDLPVDDPAVASALEYLQQFVQPDGGIYAAESLFRNYETSLSILCFVEANRDGRFDELIARAVEYTEGSQWAGNRQITESDDRYGGFGYGKHARPDLSNTSYAIDALIAAGVQPDSPAMQRVLKFVSRSQNRESDLNEMPFATKNSDGGFIYTPAGGGESKAGSTDNGGLRSYGSMTYAGLKSMLYAGVDQDDPRVQAAVDWIRMHYDLKSNPGMGAEGLYYYYHVFAKALDAIGQDTFVDADGSEHHWRQELLAELARRQADDGSWTNKESQRWMEGDPALVTGYALLALAYCKPVQQENSPANR
jgi:squalene-hopene/tetraprenyl-beta-curcumene cyclase